MTGSKPGSHGATTKPGDPTSALQAPAQLSVSRNDRLLIHDRWHHAGENFRKRHIAITRMAANGTDDHAVMETVGHLTRAMLQLRVSTK